MSELAGVEQREFASNPRVVSLDYIGGEGGYCEPFVIDVEGSPHYVLHQMYLSSEGRDPGDYVGVHRKIEYESQEELEESFREIKRRLTIPQSFDRWVMTDASLGFDIPSEEFQVATSRALETPWDQRLPL